jgi:hypothetical protein
VQSRRNIVRCKHCNDVIESKYGHDFVTCKCGTVSCDGGPEYQRILWKEGLMEDSVEILEDYPAPSKSVSKRLAVQSQVREGTDLIDQGD